MRKLRRRLFWIVSILTLILLGVGLLVTQRNPAVARNGLNAARERWETRQFADLRR